MKSIRHRAPAVRHAATGSRGTGAVAQVLARHALRSRIEAAVARLIDTLDALDAPGTDLEPWLGAPEPQTRGSRWLGGVSVVVSDQAHWAEGANDDREAVDEDGGDILDEPHDPEPDEPSLGEPELTLRPVFCPVTGRVLQPWMDQRTWGWSGKRDGELGDDNGLGDQDGMEQQIIRSKLLKGEHVNA